MSEASASVQWKGTDVCLDFHCSCGEYGHVDGRFAYHYHCVKCGRVYKLRDKIEVEELPENEAAKYRAPDALAVVRDGHEEYAFEGSVEVDGERQWGTVIFHPRHPDGPGGEP